MQTIKGLARRATQTMREKVTHADSTQDQALTEWTKKVRCIEKTSNGVCNNVLRIAKAIDEIGNAAKDIAEEYRTTPEHMPETGQMCEEIGQMAQTLIAKTAEMHSMLKEHAFDPLAAFQKEMVKLKEAEEDRKKKQLEYDFFRQKVHELRRSPPKDFTRIPRNEGILENWRQELHKSTENCKAAVSFLFLQGKQCLDKSVLSATHAIDQYFGFAKTTTQQHLLNCRLPSYPQDPVLPPSPLPPNPLPPFQQPGVQHSQPAEQQNQWGQPAPAQPPAQGASQTWGQPAQQAQQPPVPQQASQSWGQPQQQASAPAQTQPPAQSWGQQQAPPVPQQQPTSGTWSQPQPGAQAQPTAQPTAPPAAAGYQSPPVTQPPSATNYASPTQ